jgi:hypothetical protein
MLPRLPRVPLIQIALRIALVGLLSAAASACDLVLGMRASPAADQSWEPLAQRSPREVALRPPAAWPPTPTTFIIAIVITLNLLLLTACRSPFAAPTPLPQRTLTISVLTSDGRDPNLLAAGQAVVDFLFDSDPGSDERVSCDGTPLSQVTSNTGRVYFQGTIATPDGGTFACTYSGQGQTVELTFAAAPLLLLTAPSSGSVISRQDPLILTFSGGQPGSVVRVGGGAQKDAPTVVPAAHAPIQLGQGPNTGSLTLAPSVLASLRPGDGVLSVTQTYTTPLDGTPFKSAQVDYVTVTNVAVIWT